MKKGLFSFLFLLLISVSSVGQDKTIGKQEVLTREAAARHRMMLIPFEPKLYFSEIDMSINRETKMSGPQIRHVFRDGLNDQLYRALKGAGFGVLDLMEDTAKYKKDLAGIYEYLSYQYQKVPNQTNYKAPGKETTQPTIRKGQLAVETRDQNKFMNAKITNAKLVPLLYGRYKTDIFIFINQLDIRSSGVNDPMELSAGSDKRKLVVHYTVYTLDAKELNSGIAEEEFDASLNNPKKIVEKHFSRVAGVIVERVSKQLATAPK